MKTIKFYQQKVPAGYQIVCMYVKNGVVIAEITETKNAR